MKFPKLKLKCRNHLEWEDCQFQSHHGKRAKLGNFYVFQIGWDDYFTKYHEKPYALISYLPGIANDVAERYDSFEVAMDDAEKIIDHWIELAGLRYNE